MVGGQVELARAAGMPVRCLIDISQSFSRRYWPILPVIENSACDACSMSRSTCASAPRQCPGCCGTRAAPASALQLLQQVRLEVRAARDLHDLEQREQRHVVVVRLGARDEVARTLEQILEPQQRADALVQRILVGDHALAIVGIFGAERRPVCAALRASRRCRSRRRRPPRAARVTWLRMMARTSPSESPLRARTRSICACSEAPPPAPGRRARDNRATR